MALCVLTWNLKHGRAEPPAGRDLRDQFTAALCGWRWDAALLQEVPPWWPAWLGTCCGADYRLVLTSRNFGLAVRRALATRWPDLMKSNGGSANAILVRGGHVLAHHAQRLCRWPERRWVHAVRVRTSADGIVWVANLHATAHDTEAAVDDDRRAAAAARAWAGAEPLIFGGDLNLRQIELEGLQHVAGHDVDHVYVRGLAAAGEAEVLERGRLSDHAPVAVQVSS